MTDSLEGRLFVGLDVGGTTLKGARIDATGAIASRIEEPVSKGTIEALLGQLEAAVRSLAGSEDVGSIVSAVGVGLPGIVDRSGRVRVAPTVPVLNGVAVGDELRRRLGVPVAAENDANAAALAEALRGAGRGADNVLFVTLGTGIGAGLVLGGRVFPGFSGYAGEIGHIQVDPEGAPCGCGSRGCVETIAGAPGWTRRAEALLATRASTLERGALDPLAIMDAARDDDALALEVVEGAAAALGAGLASALQLLNVERVVIGGGIAAAGRFLLDRIVEHTRRRSFPQVFADCSFRLAELGPDAGIIGAGCVAVVAST